MVKLRLHRRGRKAYAFYDIVAVDSRKKRDSDYIERIGSYNPNDTVSKIVLDHSKAIKWLNVGAQASDIVRSLLSVDGALLRRHLQFKGVAESEIEAKVAEHKANTIKRYEKKKEIKKKRAAAKAEKKEEGK